MEIYAPLANRLGMGRIKGELEDLSFQHLHPDEFAALSGAVDERMKASGAAIEKLRDDISGKLAEAGIPAEVSGRVKRLWSIRQKLIRQSIPLDQLYDVLAFRVLVDSVRDCYSALGIVHQAWRPVPGRIKDYIAMPKQNFYQSLHTTVIPEGEPPFEIQIRTREMDLVAEQGIAAHWKYKEGRGSRRVDEQGIAAIRQILETTRDIANPREFLSSLKMDLYADEVYTFTPKGAVYSFPRGATPIDFAYRIHTDVGHRCVGRAGERQARAAPDAARQRRHRRDPHVAGAAALARLARLRRDVAGAEQDPGVPPDQGEAEVDRDRAAVPREGAEEGQALVRQARRREGLRRRAPGLRGRQASTTSSPRSATGRSRPAPSSRSSSRRRSRPRRRPGPPAPTP